MITVLSSVNIYIKYSIKHTETPQPNLMSRIVLYPSNPSYYGKRECNDLNVYLCEVFIIFF